MAGSALFLFSAGSDLGPDDTDIGLDTAGLAGGSLMSSRSADFGAREVGPRKRLCLGSTAAAKWADLNKEIIGTGSETWSVKKLEEVITSMGVLERTLASETAPEVVERSRSQDVWYRRAVCDGWVTTL